MSYFSWLKLGRMANQNDKHTRRVNPWPGCLAGGGYDDTDNYFIAIVDSTEKYLIAHKICRFYDCEKILSKTFTVEVNWIDGLRETAQLPVYLFPYCQHLRRVAVFVLVRLFDDNYLDWVKQASEYSARVILIGLFRSQQDLENESKIWEQQIRDHFDDDLKRVGNSKVVLTIPLVGTNNNADISYQLINKIWNSIIFEGILLTSTIGDDIAPTTNKQSRQAILYHTRFRATKSWENLFTVKVLSPLNVFYPRYVVIGMKILLDNNRATLDMRAKYSDLFLRVFSLPEEIFRKIILLV